MYILTHTYINTHLYEHTYTHTCSLSLSHTCTLHKRHIIMYTGQYNSSIYDLVVRLLCNTLKVRANIMQKDSANNKVLKFIILTRTVEKLYSVIKPVYLVK